MRTLPGKPDIVFSGARVVVFCDGDFWHGREWKARKKRLAKGANAAYWIDKIQSNIRRDAVATATLQSVGWEVIRVWEMDIHADPDAVAERILSRVHARSSRQVSTMNVTD